MAMIHNLPYCCLALICVITAFACGPNRHHQPTKTEASAPAPYVSNHPFLNGHPKKSDTSVPWHQLKQYYGATDALIASIKRPDSKSAFIGKWMDEKGGTTYEIQGDGTFRFLAAQTPGQWFDTYDEKMIVLHHLDSGAQNLAFLKSNDSFYVDHLDYTDTYYRVP